MKGGPRRSVGKGRTSPGDDDGQKGEEEEEEEYDPEFLLQEEVLRDARETILSLILESDYRKAKRALAIIEVVHKAKHADLVRRVDLLEQAVVS
uniref:Uncharacterized protein n=1 Tax=Chromera velia CCMP2878 TaxID=1169474 RepID=A0A0G4IDT7_9ALVE|eukprot:Cvel_13464.t1-p1 / transcript=Cvel_13464.t1 / gene=Cvel_13464 / organism=Chromera_velia_CCMP2878 / gene_product=hypothetical protein / transcript_product=hypothetical protein / location=Cvel_scaffold921:235-2212(-) / protein_length=93 / sequence_SO=supercontig / SO=protein_coding / is_pseudo=false